ncbi:MAG: hypothetical protein JRJ11_12040 [Deltaproteobacteria bacterium]|nr:hypothetical protein [Deltaproteobacteria bacterium]MBW2034716.1 hypothetical protein [Deltaproteobacteria bacterium]MBW2115727.1 hypothetical protein [Deltaproteobacteria bacterium]
MASSNVMQAKVSTKGLDRYTGPIATALWSEARDIELQIPLKGFTAN